MAFLDDIARRLVDQGVGVLGTTIIISSKGSVPVGPGPFLSLTQTGGPAPTRIQNKASAATRRPTAQILTRAADYRHARTMIEAAFLALDGVRNTTINGVFYLSITARNEPADIGLDDDKRPMIAFNIDTERQP